MFEKLDEIEKRFIEIENSLSLPEIINDQEKYKNYLKEHSKITEIVENYRKYKQITKDLQETEELLDDSNKEILELAREEISKLTSEKDEVQEELKVLLMPKDPLDDKNIILEIRAGTGGEEAGIFVGDLFKMYSRYAESKRWKVEILHSNPTGVGGYKEIISMIKGKNVYSCLKFESGIHRVQRVPVTEAQGRIHTSAVTVAVLPEAEDVEVEIDQNDLRIDVYRSTGPGGQSVNTTDSAVRITHVPTGIVVTCQDEKSQLKNRARAMQVLRARLLDGMIRKQNEERAQTRKDQVGSGDRSGRIRTYNFPQGRVTDHRVNLTLYKLEQILQGDLNKIVETLITAKKAESLQSVDV